MISLWLFALHVALIAAGITIVRSARRSRERLEIIDGLIKEKVELEQRLALAHSAETSDDNDQAAEREALRALIDSLQAQISTQAALVSELTHQNKTLDTKLNNTRQHIATCLQQRDFWNAWYHKQASDHGAAQHLFMSEIELHVKRGSKHITSPVFRALVNDFRDVHPALADQGKPPTAGGDPYPADSKL